MLGMLLGAGNLHGTMIVAMVAVRMVEFAVDQVVDVIAVRHRLVTAARTMLVLRVMPRRVSKMVAPVGIRLANRKNVFLHLVSFLMAEMTILQEINVAFVLNRRMPTAWAV